MLALRWVWAAAAGLAATGMALGQGFGGSGGGGFGGGGFGGGMAGGRMQQTTEDSVKSIEQAIGRYLDGDETKNILTPGEYSEWKLTLKVGEVVIAEARSDAFDPALEVVDSKNTVLASNDDRYPGDQRPLLLWRCTTEGPYSLRVRCFRDKSGGQLWLRFRVYRSVDLGQKPGLEQVAADDKGFLVRIPMKAGQITQIVRKAKEPWARLVGFSVVISPIGLPNMTLPQALWRVLGSYVFAPVSGDYYVWLYYYEWQSVGQFQARDVVQGKLAWNGKPIVAELASDTPHVWTLDAKAGDCIRAAGTAMKAGGAVALMESLDANSFGLGKDQTNPFYPQVPDPKATTKPALTTLPARAFDTRQDVCLANRDVTLWLAAKGDAKDSKDLAVAVGPAARILDDGRTHSNRLEIGCTDYWYYDAKAGEVLTFSASAAAFAHILTLYDTDLNPDVRQLALDEPSTVLTKVVQVPGRYLVALSCQGDGGSGDYSLTGKSRPAKAVSLEAPAQGELRQGEIAVWKITVNPAEPLLVHWWSSNDDFMAQTYRDSGAPASEQRLKAGPRDHYSIFTVDKPTTYIIVLTGRAGASQYKIELSKLPGFKGDVKATTPPGGR